MKPLELNNVDNTADLDKPISTATQTALDTKVDENVAIVGATNTKITYDAKGLVTASATATLASADFANQGTTITVLHGNAAGNPSFSAVSLTADVTGDLPYANLAQGAALSVLGVTGNAIADVASIVAASDHQVVRRSGTAVAFGAVNLAQSAAVTGTLDETNGGTGLAAYTQGDLIYSSAANVLSVLAKDSNATRYLSNTGSSNNPAWAQVALATGVSGTLPIGNGGTGNTTGTATVNANLTGPVTSVGNATAIVAPTYPLMNYGGKSFNGTTDYLDGNALTGIADGKKGTWVCKVRFAGAASAAEQLHDSTGVAFRVTRNSAGNIGIVAENAGGTQILSQTTSGAPCSAAGTYLILMSWDMATPGSMRIYINDVAPSITNTTFTDDTIDYTVTENAIGGTVAGATLFAGDFYYLYFNATTNIEFNTEANRRLFADSNNTLVYTGANGQLPTGSAPELFLAYDGFAKWVINRGSTTSAFVVNGTPAAPTTALNGQFAPLRDWGVSTTVTANYTVVSSDVHIINNRAATNTLTLPVANTCLGRQIYIQTIQAQTVVSASSNVIPSTGAAAGTAILPATDGAGCLLKAVSANWQIISQTV